MKIRTEPWFAALGARLFRERRGFQVYLGPWSARVSWSCSGYFGNGSRWFSGWHRWREDADV